MFVKLLAVCLVSFVVVALVAAEQEIPAEFIEIAKSLHSICQNKTDVSEEDIQNCKKGIFKDDRKLKCYMHCLVHEFKMIDDKGVINYEPLDNVPDAMKQAINIMKKDCKKYDKGKDVCQKVFDLSRCLYENGPQHYFIF